jgi:hypothetical protein
MTGTPWLVPVPRNVIRMIENTPDLQVPSAPRRREYYTRWI